MDNHRIRKTKIICTLGPASSSLEMIVKLAHAGMNVARLNFSHGTHEYHKLSIAAIRQASAQTGKRIGILQDLGGPKIRLGELRTPQIILKPGQPVTLTTGETAEGNEIPVNYAYLAEDVSPGSKILLADGLVELALERIEGGKLKCVTITGGILTSHKGVNLPLCNLRTPAFTKKDQADLEFGLMNGVDFVALSFVRGVADLLPVKEAISRSRSAKPMLLAKIEKPQAVESLNEILPMVDGIMVARGDLGVETPFERLPIIQKSVITAARRAGKPVITATQMLRSMIDSPRPTRAEATDTANAILDGTDALMLSEETAAGDYPVEAVTTLDMIARATEESYDSAKYMDEPESAFVQDTEAAMSRAACGLALKLGAVCLATSTLTGHTARMISRFRPSMPIIGFTCDEDTFRKLNLSWGVIPALIPQTQDLGTLCRTAERFARDNGLGAAGDRIIVTAGYPLWVSGSTNIVEVITINGS
ncbi:MAG: pyruvate kinase [Nitrospinae bacterium]|nr:pyruvate kinase [Nitrospinota bacterium]